MPSHQSAARKRRKVRKAQRSRNPNLSRNRNRNLLQTCQQSLRRPQKRPLTIGGLRRLARRRRARKARPPSLNLSSLRLNRNRNRSQCRTHLQNLRLLQRRPLMIGDSRRLAKRRRARKERLLNLSRNPCPSLNPSPLRNPQLNQLLNQQPTTLGDLPRPERRRKARKERLVVSLHPLPLSSFCIPIVANRMTYRAVPANCGEMCGLRPGLRNLESSGPASARLDVRSTVACDSAPDS